MVGFWGYGDSMTNKLKPILLYDHLPGILAAYPAVIFGILALLSLPQHYVSRTVPASVVESLGADAETVNEAGQRVISATEYLAAELPESVFVPNPHMLFWIALSIMIIWYVAYRFNIPKGKFVLLVGLFGTFVGIPVVLEFAGYIRPFTILAGWLQGLAPEVNAGGFFILSLVFFCIWVLNFFWSRANTKVIIDESGLMVNQLGGKGQKFDLIGLKTENEPLDYLELFLAGVGSLSLKTRMGDKPIFEMKRVIGLYRIPVFPFYRGKLAQIEEMLRQQGKSYSSEEQQAVAAASEQADADVEAEDAVASGGEGDFSDAADSSSKQDFS